MILVIIVLKQLTWNRTWLCLPNSGMIPGRNSCLFCEFPSFTDLSWPDQNDSNLTNLLQSALNANSRMHDMCRLTFIDVGLYLLGFGYSKLLDHSIRPFRVWYSNLLDSRIIPFRIWYSKLLDCRIILLLWEVYYECEDYRSI